MKALAAADIDDIGVRRRDRDVADRTGGRTVEDRMPRAAVVVRLPHAAVVDADVEHAGLRRHTDAADRAARPEWSDETITEFLIEGGIDALHVSGALRGHDAGPGRDQERGNQMSRSHSGSYGQTRS